MKHRNAISAVIASVLSVIIASVLMPIHANAQDFDKPVVVLPIIWTRDKERR